MNCGLVNVWHWKVIVRNILQEEKKFLLRRNDQEL